MAKFMFIYHGGKKPETPEAIEEEMGKWGAWMESMGAALVDGGNPAGLSKTVSAEGVADNGGSNPVSGYSLVEAEDIDAAVEMAKGCPILGTGTVEVAEAIPM